MSPPTVLADSTQLIGVLLILAGAVGYLTLYYRRKFRGESDGCGSCGIPLARTRHEDSSHPAGTRQFLPADDFSNLAARHKQKTDARAAGSSSCGSRQAGESGCEQDEHKGDASPHA